MAIKFAIKKFFHGFSSTCSQIVYSFHKLTQPILVIDKHRGSEMFAALSLHRLAIILSFLMSLNILLLLFLPYAFYIASDDFRSENATFSVPVDSKNYVDGIFHNLQLQGSAEHEIKIQNALANVAASRVKYAESSHYQLPFFYGYFRLGLADAATANNKLYKSSQDQGQDSAPTYDYAFIEEDGDEKVASHAEEDLSIMRDIYRRHLALIYVCVVFVSVVSLAIYFFRQFIWLVKGVIYDQTADTW